MNETKNSISIDRIIKEIFELETLGTDESKEHSNLEFLFEGEYDEIDEIDLFDVDSEESDFIFDEESDNTSDTDFKVTENDINNKREKFLRNKITPELLNFITGEDFEFGFVSRSEKLINEQIEVNDLATRNWLNEIFIENYKSDHILIGLLRIIGRFDQQIIFPQGQTMALAALSHRNNEIKELGIRAFENWASSNSIEILKNAHIELPWLNSYKEEVIADLEEELCHTSSER